ncbi:MAG: V-type ATPase subunit [Candidatus Thermoplasmatota archaeon]|jgi:V/A-type H+-transporting ATPase subunit C|nr:V-type ATPase subunit [Candidatus Thermoplasmatota archaeon]MCL5984252.1 V-type ATPase subunit [Candidatus Thermoplasmatota archaeon]
MSETTYAPSMGRLKALSHLLLPKDTILGLTQAKDTADVAKLLEGTTYSEDLTHAFEVYRDSDALEVAINRHFAALTRLAYQVTPFSGRTAVGAYLKWWDIENILSIIAAKAYGRILSESDTFIISERKTPAGVSAGILSIDDLRNLIAQTSVDAVVQQLARFGYGVTIMEHIGEFTKTQNLFPITRALEVQYYADLLRSSLFFQGDEWVVRQFIAEEIDVKNILTLFKGKDSEIPGEELSSLFLPGGTLPQKQLQDLSQLRSIEECVNSLGTEFGLAEALTQYKEESTLVPFELTLRRRHANRNHERMKIFPLSMAGIFHFILRARNEREDLRKIVYGKVYNLPAEKLTRELITAA